MRLIKNYVIKDDDVEDFIKDLNNNVFQYSNVFKVFLELQKLPFINVNNNGWISLTTKDFCGYEDCGSPGAQSVLRIAAKYLEQIKYFDERNDLCCILCDKKTGEVNYIKAKTYYPPRWIDYSIKVGEMLLFEHTAEHIAECFVKEQIRISKKEEYWDLWQELLMTDITEIEINGFTITKNDYRKQS